MRYPIVWTRHSTPPRPPSGCLFDIPLVAILFWCMVSLIVFWLPLIGILF